MAENKPIYMGLDFSTQTTRLNSCSACQKRTGKVMAVDENLSVIYEAVVSFDKDLPEFGTSGGVNIDDDQRLITAPTAMFIKALDMLLDKMDKQGFDFGKVVALAGDTQHCSSAYWKHGARQKLKNLDAEKTMYEQLKDEFSTPDSPSWMDTSATKQCRELEEAVGGAMEMAKVTGQRAYEHDTGPAILKLYETNRERYEKTERICMLSNFLASLFLGDYAPIDYGDGSMLNLLDIRSHHWFTKCVEACGNNLLSKLGDPVPAQTVLGNVSSYLVKRYKFSPDCKIITFTGDCLQSLVGVAARKDELIVSLGTADCLMLVWSSPPKPNLISSTVVSALDPDTMVTIAPFKNGSLTRQHVMERCAGSWEKFEELFNSTPAGNNGNLGIYFEVPEIVPLVKGTYRFNGNDELVESFPPEVEVRAVLESQFVAKYMYAKKLGIRLGSDARIIVTGGASQNKTILKIIADIFNTPVYTIDVANSAPLGGCYRAKMATEGISFEDISKDAPEPVCAALPDQELNKVYEGMLVRYEKLEQEIASKFLLE